MHEHDNARSRLKTLATIHITLSRTEKPAETRVAPLFFPRILAWLLATVYCQFSHAKTLPASAAHAKIIEGKHLKMEPFIGQALNAEHSGYIYTIIDPGSLLSANKTGAWFCREWSLNLSRVQRSLKLSALFGSFLMFSFLGRSFTLRLQRLHFLND